MIYLDNSATTRPFDEVISAVTGALTHNYFNPSSVYGPSVLLKRQIDKGRMQMLRTLGLDSGRIIFTSGATEANNLAIFGVLGAMRNKSKHVVTSIIEHPSVFEPYMQLEENGYKVTRVGVDETGRVSEQALLDALREDTCLVSIMHVNNETGAINDIRALSSIVKKHCKQAVFHCDGVQAYGRITPDLGRCNVDLYSISAHKFHGMKGIGALIAKDGIKIAPMMIGGGQEDGYRSGTTNAPAIIGMIEAARICYQSNNSLMNGLQMCKAELYNGLLNIPDAYVNGPNFDEAAPYILNMSFEGVRGETLLHSLERHKIFVSTGSACSAKSKKASRALSAMGITGDRALGAVRMSLGAYNDVSQMQRVVEIIDMEVKDLRRYRRV